MPRRSNEIPIRVILEVGDPAAVRALAEALGELAADLWLDGKFELPLTDESPRKIVGK